MSDGRDGDPSEVPHDVRASLTQLFDEAHAAASAGDDATATALLEAADTVAANKLPPGERRTMIRRGCEAATDALPNGDLAAAYVAAAAARVPET